MPTDHLLSWEREFMSLFVSHSMLHTFSPLHFSYSLYTVFNHHVSSGNMTVTSGMLFTRTSQYLFFIIPTEMASTILLTHFLNV